MYQPYFQGALLRVEKNSLNEGGKKCADAKGTIGNRKLKGRMKFRCVHFLRSPSAKKWEGDVRFHILYRVTHLFHLCGKESRAKNSLTLCSPQIFFGQVPAALRQHSSPNRTMKNEMPDRTVAPSLPRDSTSPSALRGHVLELLRARFSQVTTFTGRKALVREGRQHSAEAHELSDGGDRVPTPGDLKSWRHHVQRTLSSNEGELQQG